MSAYESINISSNTNLSNKLLQVVIFRTEPISLDDVAPDITPDIKQCYSSFITTQDSHQLSINLLLISQHERKLYTYLRTMNHSTNKYQSIKTIISYDNSTLTKVGQFLYTTNLSELYERDDGVLIKNEAYMYHYSPLAVVALVDGQYRGHVYAWSFARRDTVDMSLMQVMNVMGIRVSMYAMLSKYSVNPDPSLSGIMIDGIRQYCNIHYPEYTTWLRIVSPMPVMQRIAAKLGMQLSIQVPEVAWLNVELEDDEYLYEDWLLNDSYIGGGPVTSEEEAFDKSSDYVIDSTQLLNNIPEYKLIDHTLNVVINIPI